MMKRLATLGLILTTIAAGAAWAQGQARNPQIGYAYPAGGERGKTVDVIVGGQYLRGTEGVYINGEGVTGEVVDTYRVPRRLKREQRETLVKDLRSFSLLRWQELYDKGELDSPPPEYLKRDPAEIRRRMQARRVKSGQPAEKANAKQKAPAAKAEGKGKRAQAREGDKEMMAELPKNPLLTDMDKKSLWELAHIRKIFFEDYTKRQENAQIGEMALVRITIAPDATPGDRELRLTHRAGITNPVVFQVGDLPEARELEPNDPNQRRRIPPRPPLETPVLVNGQVLPGDVDRIPFKARKGQRLAIVAQARHLVPFLADAVPGWFQATLAVYDESGKELAFDDDYRFNPDPVLFYQIPADGTYQLEIHDSIYRGREDFVYRVAITERPFITQAFPLGGTQGQAVKAHVKGWNLPDTEIPLDTSPGGPAIRWATVEGGKTEPLNGMLYAVSDLPELVESEPNDSPAKAQKIAMPRIVNGRIGKPGDTDVYAFQGKKGDEVVLEVTARRLYSPVDSVVHLLDAKGKTIAWNDDNVDKVGHLHRDMGYLTHHADSYLRAALPADGTYYVRMADAQVQGGGAWAYRLRISPPRPDFSLEVAPSSVVVRMGGSETVRVYALRHDGYEGPIDVSVQGGPENMELAGNRIPAGRGSTRMTITMPWSRNAPTGTARLRFTGTATIDDHKVAHAAVPCDNTMQAFLWRHLAPKAEFVASMGARGGVPIRPLEKGVVKVPAGGKTVVHCKAPSKKWWKNLTMALDEPPEGISIADVEHGDNELTFAIQADGQNAKAGLADNLIVEVFREVTWKGKDGRPDRTFQRSAGVMPAIAFEVVGK